MRGEGKGQMEEVREEEEMGETDHLRSVGRRHKPVGEGRSLLDSALQRDRRRERRNKGKFKKETKRMENGQDRHGEIVLRSKP